ncbi:MAG: tail fiber protein [Acidobacteriota bacterium]
MNYFLGEIVILPFSFAPRGLDFCNGQLLPIPQNVALYSLIGTTFGGDGNTTFALPDYRNQAPAGSQYFIAMEGIYPKEPGKE